MRTDLETRGYQVNVVAINLAGADSSVEDLAARSTFDVLQDTAEDDVWGLLGGGKDDFFIYRRGGRLSPGGYLRSFGLVSTVLSTPEGYQNVLSAIMAAADLGPGEPCALPLEGHQLPGNINQDAQLDISDAVSLLGHLFLGGGSPPPCEGVSLMSGGNRKLADVNEDRSVDLSDAVYLLNYLFLGGPPPLAGESCVPILGCPEACAGG